MVRYSFGEILPIPDGAKFVDMILSRLQRQTSTEVHPQFKIGRIREFYIKKVNYAQSLFENRLGNILEQFPMIDGMHPFYGELLKILYNKDYYKLALSQIKNCKNMIEKVRKEYVRLLKVGESPYQCKTLKRAALGKMVKQIKKIKSTLKYLEDVRQHLQRLPTIDPTEKTLLISGYPNVGKSSFINKITKANVDVQSYAFTTKNLYVGHFDYDYTRWQCIDTPGILDRPLEKRNQIEWQAIASLVYLQATVLFFIDISDQTSYTLDQQLSLLNSLKSAFADKPLVVVLTKIDITPLEKLSQNSKELLQKSLALFCNTLRYGNDDSKLNQKLHQEPFLSENSDLKDQKNDFNNKVENTEPTINFEDSLELHENNRTLEDRNNELNNNPENTEPTTNFGDSLELYENNRTLEDVSEFDFLLKWEVGEGILYENKFFAVIAISSLAEKGLSDVLKIGCKFLLKKRISEKISTSKLETMKNILNPVIPDVISPPPKLPDLVEEEKILQKINPSRLLEIRSKTILEKDLEKKGGGPGVYNVDFNKNYILEKDEWKYDKIPEVFNGMNISDFYHENIEQVLNKNITNENHLKTEQETLEQPFKDLATLPENLSNVLLKIKDKKSTSKQIHSQKDHSRHTSLPMTKQKNRKISHLRDRLNELGLENMKLKEGTMIAKKNAENYQKSLKKHKQELEIKSQSLKIGSGIVLLKNRSALLSESIDPQSKGLKSLDDQDLAIKKSWKAFSGKVKGSKDTYKGTGDRINYTKRPKHLFSGKRKLGKADRR